MNAIQAVGEALLNAQAQTAERPVPEVGLHAGVPEADYHGWAGVSQSQLKVLRDFSPAHLRWQLDHPSEPTDALILGAAVHDFVLLPELAEEVWVRAPEGDRRTKAVKEAWQALEAAYPNATILKATDYDTCVAVRDAIAAHPTARQLLVGQPEQSAVWSDPDTGVLCRGRYDLLGERTGTIVDLKTCRSAAPEAFSLAVWNFGYHLQAAHYLAGAKALGLDYDRFAFVAVEKDPPYCVALYELTEADVYDGERELRPLLARYAQCLDNDEWPAYPTEVRLLQLPAWAPRKIDERLLGEA